MPDQEAILTAILYGSDGPRKEHESRIELELRPRVPEHAIVGGVDGKTAWLRQWLIGKADGAIKDVKHSHDWLCEFCARPARETVLNTLSWAHITPPRMNIYLHAFCNTDSFLCREEFEELDRTQARKLNMPWKPPSHRPPLPPGFSLALLASCAGCERDETAGPGAGRTGTLFRCSSCKMTRYCSSECQTNDWKRHKPACKAVHNLKWVLEPE